MTTVGIIGLGELGSAVSRRLLESGYEVVGYDPDAGRAAAAADAGVQIVSGPDDTASTADVVVLLVKTIDHADVACFGASGCVRHLGGKALVVMSSLAPDYVRRLAAAVTARGGAVLDVPSGGGAPAAGSGCMSLMVSGPDDALVRVQPVLGCLGTTTRVGAEPGMAQAAKLITQVALSVNLTALRESIEIGSAFGLDPELLMSVIVSSSGNSFVAEHWAYLVDFLEETHIANISKDVATVLDVLPVGSPEVPVTRAALDALRATWPVRRAPVSARADAGLSTRCAARSPRPA